MTPHELTAACSKGKFPTCCFIYGDEPFLVERAVQQLLAAVIDPSLKDFNFNVFYGNESLGTDIVDAAQTLPMFAERRAVLVKRADQLKADALELLLPYILNPSSCTCLILTGNKIDQRKKFFTEFKKHGELIECKKLYDNKLAGFIQAEAVVQGKPIDTSAAELLALFIGNNLQELSSQVEKLVVYAGKKQRIGVDDVRTMASNSKSYTAFELAKYLGMRELAGAVKSLDALFLHGDDAPMIIGALASHFRKVWRVRELLDRNIQQTEISRLAGINPYFLSEIVTQARNFNKKELQKIFEEFYRCDVASKTGGHPYGLLHGLSVGICTGGW